MTMYEDRQLVQLARNMMAVQPVTTAAQANSIWTGGIWTPGIPMAPGVPQSTSEYGMRRFDYDSGYNYGNIPRAKTTVDGRTLNAFEELYALVTLCNFASMAIRYKVNEAHRVKMRFGPISGDKNDAKKLKANIQKVENFFRKPDGRNYFVDWRTRYVKDVVIYDALSIAKIRYPNGKLKALKLIAGNTITPRIDPLGEPVFYDQIIKGQVYARYIDPSVDVRSLPQSIQSTITGELVYRPRWQMNGTAYGCPPAQDIIDALYTAIEWQEFHKAYWKDGNIGQALIGIPGNVTGKQLQQLKMDLRDLYAGNHEGRNQYQLISINDSGQIRNSIYEPRQFSPDVQYAGELRRTILAPFGIVESELGWTEKTGKTTNEGQEDVKNRDTLSMTEWEKPFFDDIIQSPDGLNEPEIEVTYDFGKPEDQLTTMQTLIGYLDAQSRNDDGSGPILLNSEVRQRVFPDLDPIDIVELASLKVKKKQLERELDPPAPPTPLPAEPGLPVPDPAQPTKGEEDGQGSKQNTEGKSGGNNRRTGRSAKGS